MFLLSNLSNDRLLHLDRLASHLCLYPLDLALQARKALLDVLTCCQILLQIGKATTKTGSVLAQVAVHGGKEVSCVTTPPFPFARLCSGLWQQSSCMLPSGLGSGLVL